MNQLLKFLLPQINIYSIVGVLLLVMSAWLFWNSFLNQKRFKLLKISGLVNFGKWFFLISGLIFLFGISWFNKINFQNNIVWYVISGVVIIIAGISIFNKK